MNGVASTRPAKGRIIVCGIAFWYPLAGVTYQFLHYLVGLRRLGYDPFYVEDSARWVYDPRTNAMSPDAGGNVAALAPIFEAHGFGDRWAFRGAYPGGRSYGIDERALERLYGEADVLLNITGSQEIRDEHRRCRRRIYVESDPGAAQFGVALGHARTIAALDAHDTHFTFGENLGAADCKVPIERYRWLPTRQPVVLSLWDHHKEPAPLSYTTIATWRNQREPITYEGETYYWTKDREFMRVIDLPARRRESFELAVGVDDGVQTMLAGHAWRSVNSVELSRNPERYRAYIQASRGEFTVARDQYVRPRTGWFSDRSACYLAAGRPVITQETAFSKVLPTGRGLYAFETIDDVMAAIDAVESDYPGNCRAARDIAESCFSAETVISSLLERAGL